MLPIIPVSGSLISTFPSNGNILIKKLSTFYNIYFNKNGDTIELERWRLKSSKVMSLSDRNSSDAGI